MTKPGSHTCMLPTYVRHSYRYYLPWVTFRKYGAFYWQHRPSQLSKAGMLAKFWGQLPSAPAVMNGLAFLHLHHHWNPHFHRHYLHHHLHHHHHHRQRRRRRCRRRHHHHHYNFNYVYVPWSKVWNPCISDVRSIRDKNTVPRIIPFKMRMTQANNPTITL